MTLQEDVLAEFEMLRSDGLIKAEEVLDWAEANRESAIARRLQWDDAKAGHLYRLNQIRTLIRIYIVDTTGSPLTVSLSVDRASPGGGYRDVGEVKATPNLRRVLLEDLMTELERMADRHFDITELEPVWGAIALVRANMRRATSRSQQERAAAATLT